MGKVHKQNNSKKKKYNHLKQTSPSLLREVQVKTIMSYKYSPNNLK